MKTKDYIIIALAILAGFLLLRGPGTPVVDTSVIRKARADSARYATQIEKLQGEIKYSNEVLSDSALWYENKIKSLERLNVGQIDTIFIERYGSPISTIEVRREVAKDLYRYDSVRMELAVCKNVNSLQAKMIQVHREIIKTDSIQLQELPNMEREIKRLKSKLFWTKIGAVGAVAAIILVVV